MKDVVNYAKHRWELHLDEVSADARPDDSLTVYQLVAAALIVGCSLMLICIGCYYTKPDLMEATGRLANDADLESLTNWRTPCISVGHNHSNVTAFESESTACQASLETIEAPLKSSLKCTYSNQKETTGETNKTTKGKVHFGCQRSNEDSAEMVCLAVSSEDLVEISKQLDYRETSFFSPPESFNRTSNLDGGSIESGIVPPYDGELNGATALTEGTEVNREFPEVSTCDGNGNSSVQEVELQEYKEEKCITPYFIPDLSCKLPIDIPSDEAGDKNETSTQLNPLNLGDFVTSKLSHDLGDSTCTNLDTYYDSDESSVHFGDLTIDDYVLDSDVSEPSPQKSKEFDLCTNRISTKEFLYPESNGEMDLDPTGIDHSQTSTRLNPLNFGDFVTSKLSHDLEDSKSTNLDTYYDSDESSVHFGDLTIDDYVLNSDVSEPSPQKSKEFDFCTNSISAKEFLYPESNIEMDFHPTGIYHNRPTMDKIPIFNKSSASNYDPESPTLQSECSTNPRDIDGKPSPSTGAIPKDWEVIRRLNAEREPKRRRTARRNSLDENPLCNPPVSPRAAADNGTLPQGQQYYDSLRIDQCIAKAEELLMCLESEKSK